MGIWHDFKVAVTVITKNTKIFYHGICIPLVKLLPTKVLLQQRTSFVVLFYNQCKSWLRKSPCEVYLRTENVVALLTKIYENHKKLFDCDICFSFRDDSWKPHASTENQFDDFSRISKRLRLISTCTP